MASTESMLESGWLLPWVPQRSSPRWPELSERPMASRPVLAQRLSRRPVFSPLAFSPQPVWPQAWRQRLSLLVWPQVSLPL